MPEIFRNIEGFEGLYQISNYGRVKSLKSGCNMYGRFDKVKILSLRNCHGYKAIFLCKNNVRKQCLIQRLVAKAFLPNPDNLPFVNHKDENKENNFVWVNEDGTVDPEKSNLEWCNEGYNVNYGTATRRRAKKLTNGKKSMPVLQFTLDGQFVKEYESLNEVSRQTGFPSSNICNAIHGKGQKTSNGFIWRYKEKE